MKNSQISIEFLLLAGLSICIAIVMLVTITALTVNKTDEKTYYEIDDYGVSLQQEVILAGELEDGYNRRINIPITINGRSFTINNSYTSASNLSGYFTIDYNTIDIYYAIPPITGNLTKGLNILTKNNSRLYVRLG